MDGSRVVDGADLSCGVRTFHRHEVTWVLRRARRGGVYDVGGHVEEERDFSQSASMMCKIFERFLKLGPFVKSHLRAGYIRYMPLHHQVSISVTCSCSTFYFLTFLPLTRCACRSRSTRRIGAVVASTISLCVPPRTPPYDYQTTSCHRSHSRA